MDGKVFSLDDIKAMVKPIAEKYQVEAIYLFGSYARGEADEESDLDFLVFGGQALSAHGFLPLPKSCALSLKRKPAPLR